MELGAIVGASDSISLGNLIVSVLLVLLGVPASILAWHAIKGQRQAEKDRAHREADQRVTELVGAAFFGPDKSKWPTPDQLGGRTPAFDQLQGVAHQVRPSNGTTIATMIEEIKAEIKGVTSGQANQAGQVEEIRKILAGHADQVDDLQRGMAKFSVLVAEHVSDGHGGQRSW